MRKRSTLERDFGNLLARFTNAPRPVRELVFHPTRKWRFDFAWPAHMVAVELEGGIFVHGRHNRGPQFSQDCEKHNAAVMLGWRILRFTTLDIRKRPVQIAQETAELLAKIEPREHWEQAELFATEF